VGGHHVGCWVLGVGLKACSKKHFVMKYCTECWAFCLLDYCFLNIKIKTYSNINLPVVLYGCETWSVIVMEKQHMLRIILKKKE
jgi:hypothetical protein